MGFKSKKSKKCIIYKKTTEIKKKSSITSKTSRQKNRVLGLGYIGLPTALLCTSIGTGISCYRCRYS
jgi:hypothetical protein